MMPRSVPAESADVAAEAVAADVPARVRVRARAPEAAEQAAVRRLAFRSRRIRKNDVCPKGK